MKHCENVPGWKRGDCRRLGLRECADSPSLARHELSFSDDGGLRTVLLLCDGCAASAREALAARGASCGDEAYTPRCTVAYVRHTNRQSHFAVVYDWDEWPQGSLASRGWTDARVFHTRPATPEEIESLAKARRYLAFRAPSAAAILEDEEKILGSHPQELARLKQALSRFETDSPSPTHPTKTEATPTA